MAAREVTIGMDVGGTKWETALVDGQGRILASVRTASRYGMRVEELVEGARASVAKLKAQVEGIELVGVGVGFAGQIDPETGTVIGSPNVGWQNVPLKEALEFAFNLPVVVVNDVQAATWVEWKLGSGRGATHLACIFVGTGIGGGLILDGKLYRGSAGSAGEIGHTILNAQGTLCRCGAQGCLEAYAGGWAIALRAQEAVQRDTEGGRLMLALAGGDLRQVTAATVSQAAHTGDPLAARLVQEVGADLGVGVASAVNAFNPQVVVLGGGVIEGLPELTECVRVEVKRRGLASATAALRIERAALGSYAGVIGAALLARGHQRPGGSGLARVLP